MKTKRITQTVLALAVVVIAISCGTSRSYPDTRSYPDRYPQNDRVVIIRDQAPYYGQTNRIYRRNPVRKVYVAPNRKVVKRYDYKVYKNNKTYRGPGKGKGKVQQERGRRN